MKKYIDISVPISPQMPIWEGSYGVYIQPLMEIAKGDTANVSQLSLDIHSGTHIDSPLHFIENGKTTNEISLSHLIGPCYVANLEGIESIDFNHLSELHIPPNISKLLLKTDNSQLWENPTHTFYKDFVALTAKAAKWVTEHNFHLVGIDYHSIQRFHDGSEVHQVLLRNDVVILEGLDLRNVEAGVYNLLCLPIKIEGVEGATARAILTSISDDRF